MKFGVLYWLLLIPVLIPAVMLFIRWGNRRRRESLDRVIAPRLHEQLLRSVDYSKRHFKEWLIVLALAALTVALSRPLSGFLQVKVERPGVDVMLCFDISRSMTAEDAATNRLSAAKAALEKLLERPSNDRFGLVAFAGEAYLVAPITQDHGSILRSASAVSVTSISKPGTDMAAAIRLAIKSFTEKHESGKAIIVITDGEELQGDAVVAAREAVTKGVSIYTVGVGTLLGSRLPNRQYGRIEFSKNEFGNDVVSKLNERVLQQVAAAGRGYYMPLGKEGEGLLDISERGLSTLARGTQMRQSKDMREYFQLPLGICVLLLFWELLVRERKREPAPILR